MPEGTNRKLTPLKVHLALKAYQERKESVGAIAKRFGVCRTAITHMARRKAIPLRVPRFN